MADEGYYRPLCRFIVDKFNTLFQSRQDIIRKRLQYPSRESLFSLCPIHRSHQPEDTVGARAVL
jgi:hypothetical protein